jgi:predicted PurR-regulated permease PerM
MSNASAEKSDSFSTTKDIDIDIFIRIGVSFLLMVWCFEIIRPIVTPILWGVVIAIGVYPIYQWLIKKTNLSNTLGATLFTLSMLILLITPTIMLTGVLFENAESLTRNLESGTLSIPESPDVVSKLPLIGKKLDDFWTQVAEDPKTTLGQLEPHLKAFGEWMLKAAAGASLSMIMFVFSIIIAGIFIAKAGVCNKTCMIILNRLVGERADKIAKLSYNVVLSVIRGIVGVAFIQAMLAGLGFMAMGIPGAGILFMICLVVAVVQISIAFILIPISIYAFSFANTDVAIVFLIWNLVIGLMDNVLKPLLLGRGVDAPMLLVFLGAIGGLLHSGILGLFIGPVVLVLGYKLLLEWLVQGPESAENI